MNTNKIIFCYANKRGSELYFDGKNFLRNIKDQTKTKNKGDLGTSSFVTFHEERLHVRTRDKDSKTPNQGSFKGQKVFLHSLMIKKSR